MDENYLSLSVCSHDDLICQGFPHRIFFFLQEIYYFHIIIYLDRSVHKVTDDGVATSKNIRKIARECTYFGSISLSLGL